MSAEATIDRRLGQLLRPFAKVAYRSEASQMGAY